jgi:alginate O-acetyltransferase complex protein AlgI
LVFSSPLFLYIFLPVVLALYYAAHYRLRNVMLLLASLLFYAWGEPVYLLLMLFSILMNWIVGLALSAAPSRRAEYSILTIGVTFNLLILGYFKYASFFVANLNRITGPLFHHTLDVSPMHLPIGISFFTFHAISYIVDIYRRQAHALKNPINMGLYISLFPQLIAGPIIRYHDIAEQLLHRSNTVERFASGVERFVFGLGKKVLVANTLGQVADGVFATQVSVLSPSIAWLGILCYTLQIYFDFSGYSDMAVGLARMFGFELTENFNYPYIARSIREFWRRWHLSLSTWFRDYLYIPLGGNRGPASRVRFNLFAVFVLCGLWHGASWNFAIWGLFHGALLVMERGRFGVILDQMPGAIARLYTLFAAIIGWVFFRAENLSHATGFLSAMFGANHAAGIPGTVRLLLNPQMYVALAVGAILATPVATFFARDWRHRRFPAHAAEPLPRRIADLALEENSAWLLSVRTVATFSILILCAAQLAGSTYNPFIYFRF